MKVAEKGSDEDPRTRRQRWGRARQNHPGFGLYIALMIFTLLNIPSRLPIMGAARPTLILVAVIAMLVVVNGGHREHRDTSTTTRYLNILVAYMLLTVPFVQWPGSVLRFGFEGFLKAAIFFYFTVHLVDSLRRLQILIAVFLSCQVVRILEPLYLHVATGYWGDRAHMGGGEFMSRLAGAPTDIINPNGLAFVVLTALPFLHYLLGGSRRKLLRLLYVALVPLLLYAFILTGSRSGMVGLMVLVAFVIWRSRHRASLIAAIGLAGIGMVSVMDTDMKDRYLSLAESGTRHEETKQGRLEGVIKDFQVGLRKPLFGHGLGTSAEALAHFRGRMQKSHNLYTEVLIETGIVGLLLFLRVLVSIFKNVQAVAPAVNALAAKTGSARGVWDNSSLSYITRLSSAILAWLVMCLVFSLATYGLSQFYWYMIAGVSVALGNIVGRSPPMDVSAIGPRTTSVVPWSRPAEN